MNTAASILLACLGSVITVERSSAKVWRPYPSIKCNSLVLPTAPSNNPPVDGSQRKKRTNPNEALVLSTAPEDPPTHWQQTLIYLYDPIDVEQDQLIEGSATLTQSKENRRFMNINLQYSSGGRSFVKESVMR
ncbi:unnamed protein product [Dovyalis caffra]|uniref:Protein arginine N-methyltransferase domain-containing protein n=1 Tax=Dovyalis caffra TaxID=77055 RepID=A0AAV1RMJ0_9ROSI|nr:unnamed protein product [Dovyalis caffra]